MKAVNDGDLPLQVKLHDVFEGLVVVEIASNFHLDRDDTMATLFALSVTSLWKCFFRRCKVMRGNTAADVGHDYLGVHGPAIRGGKEGRFPTCTPKVGEVVVSGWREVEVGRGWQW